jgi:hypothetical protein
LLVVGGKGDDAVGGARVVAAIQDVGFAVAIDVRQGACEGAATGNEARSGAEAAAAGVQQDRNGIAPGVGHQKIGPAVAVYVAHAHQSGMGADRVIALGGEDAVAVVHQHRNRAVSEITGHDVQLAIAIHVRCGDGSGPRQGAEIVPAKVAIATHDAPLARLRERGWG